MAIQPNTILKILKGIPFDDTYENTILFDSVTNQTNYFINKVKPSANGVIYTLSNYSYQRANKNSIRVQIKADNLYDCNYIMFQNSSYGNKWFYAFIKGVNYINDVTSEIIYEIDDIQTWHFDYKLADTFVEREHASTDNPGDNVIDENLELGELIINNSNALLSSQRKHQIIMYTTFDSSLNNSLGFNAGLYAPVYTGLHGIVINERISPEQMINNANDFLNLVNINGLTDGVVAIYMLPNWMYVPYVEGEASVADDIDGAGGTIQNLNIIKRNNPNASSHTIDGYKPRNHKLYTFPYNFLRISTDNNVGDFKYEYFNGSNCDFSVDYCVFPAPIATIKVNNYIKGDSLSNADRRLTLTDFPQCAYVNDVFKVYLAQNQGSIAAKQFATETGAISGITNNLVNGIVSAAFGNVGGAISGGMGVANSVVNAMVETNNLLGQLRDVSVKPNQANGSQSSMADYTFGVKNFVVKYMSISRRYAERLDTFFDMYGYKTLTVKKPYRHSRQLWTYCKTVGCDIHGSIPVDSASKICSIYDRGITWWWCNSSVTIGANTYNIDDIIGEYNKFAGYNTPLGNNAQ